MTDVLLEPAPELVVRNVVSAPMCAVPAVALEAWFALQVALVVAGPTPCEADPELWFARAEARAEDAVYGCSRCPVLTACRAYALAAGERDGTWGGLTEMDRREMSGRGR